MSTKKLPVPGQRFNPYGMFKGVFIPSGLINFNGLKWGPKIVWGQLAYYAGENGECYPSERTLGLDLNKDPRTIQRHVRALREVGFIETKRRDGHRNLNQYYFLMHECLLDSFRGVSPVKAVASEKQADRSVVSHADKPVAIHDDKPVGSETSEVSYEQKELKETRKEQTDSEEWWVGVESSLGDWVIKITESFPYGLEQKHRRYIILHLAKRLEKGGIESPVRYASSLAKKGMEGHLDISDYAEYETWLEEKKRQAIRGKAENLRDRIKTTYDACELACQWVEKGKYTEDEMYRMAKEGKDIEGVPGWLFSGYVKMVQGW